MLNEDRMKKYMTKVGQEDKRPSEFLKEPSRNLEVWTYIKTKRITKLGRIKQNEIQKEKGLKTKISLVW